MNESNESDMNEILFGRFGVNYNNEDDMFKKGTLLLRQRVGNQITGKQCVVIVPKHVDFNRNRFWNNQNVLNEKCVDYCDIDVSSLSHLVSVQLSLADSINNSKKLKCT